MIEIQSKRTAKQNTWRETLARQKNSGMTIAAFCKAQGLNFHIFHYWQRKFARLALTKQAHVSGNFVSVANRTDTSAQKARIILPNGVQVDLGGGLDAATVRQFLQNLCGVSGARA